MSQSCTTLLASQSTTYASQGQDGEMDTAPTRTVATKAEEPATEKQRKQKRRRGPSISPFFANSDRSTRSRNKVTRQNVIRQPEVPGSPVHLVYNEWVLQPSDDQSISIEKEFRRKTSRKNQGPMKSPYFKVPLGGTQSQDPVWSEGNPYRLAFELRPKGPVGLIQERICSDLFALVVQAMLWNKTRGVVARPVLFELLSIYPSPEDLAVAEEKRLVSMIRCLGLQYQRSRQLISMATVWIKAPPRADIVLQKKTLKPREKGGWEISHLPGIGRYAEDSFRIFGRDQLRGVDVTRKDFEPEWKRVTPIDKELKRYISWKWAQEGYDYESGRHWGNGSSVPDIGIRSVDKTASPSPAVS